VSLPFSLDSFRRAHWRLRLVVLCLLAFSMQSALASAHLHISSYGRTTDGVVASLFTTDLGDQAAPTDLAKRAGDNGNCPLCQFLILGSAALHPAVLALLTPVECAAIIVGDQTPPRFVSAVSYSWQGRGPPQL
jgi:hypothetical protein